MVDTASKTGFISQIIGPVVDVEYPNGELPKIYNALVISPDGGESVTCEVQQLLGNNKVRAVSMTSSYKSFNSVKYKLWIACHYNSSIKFFSWLSEFSIASSSSS